MAKTRMFLKFWVGMCLVSLVLSAAVEYEEPDMEVSTANGSKDDADDGPGDRQDEEDASGEMEDIDTLSEDMDDKDTGTGDMDDKDAGSGDMDDKESSGDKEMDKAMTKEKLDDVSKEGEEGGSSSSEEDGSPSGKEAPAATKCPGGPGLDALMSGMDKENDKDCQVTKTLKAMLEFLGTMSDDINTLKEQVSTTCSGGAADKTAEDDGSGSGSGDGEEQKMEGSGDADKKKDCDHKKDDDGDDSEELTLDVTTTPEPSTTPAPTLPPPPTSCPSPFQLLASGCFYIQTNPREWRSWGEAQAFCQQQSGSLATPMRPQEFRDYLQQSYSSTIWVGARSVNSKWSWLNGNEMVPEDWKEGKPSNQRAKRCVYLDSWSMYKGVNHYCGEKFSFACEHSGM